MSRRLSFARDQRGAASVEFALLAGVLIAVTIATLELGIGYFQYNSAKQATRIGARLAVTSDPVARDLKNYTGLGGGVISGDPMPAYSRRCSGQTQNCTGGQYDSTAMNALIFGPDNDGNCAPTQKLRRGMCDIQTGIQRQNVEVTYRGSGLGVAGNPAVLSPLVTVKVSGLKFDFLVVDAFLPANFTDMPDITVSMMAEDLRTRR